MAGYIPEANGNIPADVQKIESIGEACHDFTIARSKKSVVDLRKQLISTIPNGVNFQKTEHEISKLLNTAFNGTGNIKAYLDLSDTSKVYNTPEQLTSDLFFGTDGVNPLVFTISATNLPRFQPVLQELKRRFSLYGFENSITHDAYSRPGRTEGNPFEADIKYSAATTCDSGVAGSSAEVLQTAMEDGYFIMDRPLVSGRSFWGTWAINTNLTPSGNYGGATVTINMGGIAPIQITLPRALTRSPSVNELSLMLDGVISRKTLDQILISINKHLSVPAIRAFYTDFIGHVQRLYSADPYSGLKLVLIWKELGDMSQHLVAVKYKHIAGGSVDGLSTIAFLKRGVPCSYIIASIKGLDHVRFRVAGTSHMQAGSAADIARRKAEAAAAQAAQRAEAAQRIADKAAMKEALRVAAAAEEEEKKYVKAAVKAASNARRGAKSGVVSARRGNLIGGSRWKKTARKLRKNRNKTYKQKGGANMPAEDLIDRLIDVLFDYSNAAAGAGGGGGGGGGGGAPAGLPADCSLFNVKDAPFPITPDYIDLTLIVQKDGENLFIDNALLGLPLASIIYLLGEKLKGQSFTKVETNTIIEDFLRSFNFTESEIEYIKIKMSEPSARAPPAPLGKATLGETVREATDSDIETFQVLVDNYGAVIPGFEITPSTFLPDVEDEEEEEEEEEEEAEEADVLGTQAHDVNVEGTDAEELDEEAGGGGGGGGGGPQLVFLYPAVAGKLTKGKRGRNSHVPNVPNPINAKAARFMPPGVGPPPQRGTVRTRRNFLKFKRSRKNSTFRK